MRMYLEMVHTVPILYLSGSKTYACLPWHWHVAGGPISKVAEETLLVTLMLGPSGMGVPVMRSNQNAGVFVCLFSALLRASTNRLPGLDFEHEAELCSGSLSPRKRSRKAFSPDDKGRPPKEKRHAADEAVLREGSRMVFAGEAPQMQHLRSSWDVCIAKRFHIRRHESSFSNGDEAEMATKKEESADTY